MQAVLQRFHDRQQLLVAVDLVVPEVFIGEFIEQLFGAGDLRRFNGPQIHALHGSLGFRDEEKMLLGSGPESYCPVGGIVADRSGDVEAFGQLGIDADFIGCIQILGKTPLYAFFRITVGEDIVLYVLSGLVRLVKTCLFFLCRKDRAVIFTLDLVVGDVFHDHR